MLQSLGRNGVVERYLLSRHRHHVLKPGGIRKASTTFISSSNAISFHQRTSHLYLRPPSARSLSTPASSTSPSKDTADAHTVPLSRKAKVELRPGPIKPPATGTSSRLATAKQSSATDTVTTLQASSSKAKLSGSLTETVKEDFKQAYIHGVLSPPPSDAGKIAKLWHQAKELFKFYARGLKLVVTHRKQVNEILARVKAGGEPMSRWESRFIQTNKGDLARLVPFIAIVLILEEIIPLIVLYAPGMLPSTCILTSQRERIEGKRREKQRAYAETMREEFLDVFKAGPAALVSTLPGPSSAIALCGLLSLSTWGPQFWRKSRIEHHLKLIAADDALLAKEGMGDRLTHPELLEALEERGIIAEGLSTKALKARLRWWLTEADRGDEGTVVSRRITLASQSGLGKFSDV
ncbi:hypothetical protein BC834DRAFT_867242 [Gloeopeniophorella convolvens]|nr:hypothetical protein BC834DRAFT_867242 [Gloeopeniophorella convolvens]